MDQSGGTTAVEVEISAWFDRMRRKMPQGGVSFPREQNRGLVHKEIFLSCQSPVESSVRRLPADQSSARSLPENSPA